MTIENLFKTQSTGKDVLKRFLIVVHYILFICGVLFCLVGFNPVDRELLPLGIGLLISGPILNLSLLESFYSYLGPNEVTIKSSHKGKTFGYR